MNIERCDNMNHSKTNVLVRFCPSCGKVVNKNVQILKCEERLHQSRIKERNRFCVDCGKALFVGR